MSFRSVTPEDQSNPVRTILTIIVPLIGVLIIMFRFCTPSPCQKILDHLITNSTLPKQSKGLDGTYQVLTDSVIVNLYEYKDTTNDFFEEVIAPMVRDLSQKAAQRLPIDANLLLKYQNDAIVKKEMVNEEKFVHYLLTISPEVPPFELTVNDVCQLKYKVDLKYQQDLKDALPNELQENLNKIINDCPEFKNFRLAPVNTIVDFSKLLDCIKAQEERLIAIRKKYEPLFKMVNFGIPWLETNGGIRFAPGDYQISGVDQLFIEALIEEYKNVIIANPEKTYRIVCTGYADPSIPGPNGLPYIDGGRYNNEQREIEINNSEEEKIPSKIGSNHHLSFARAYSGAEYLYRSFDLLRDERYKIKINVAYIGKGVDQASDKSYQEKRRIEFKLSVGK